MASDTYLSDSGANRRPGRQPPISASSASCPASPRGGSIPSARSAAAVTATTPVPLRRNSIFVADVHPDVAEQQLVDLFGGVGPVRSVRICRDPVTRRSLGYAYVNYRPDADPGVVGKALGELNYTKMAGRPIRLMRFERDPKLRPHGADSNLFVKGLGDAVGTKALHDLFSQFGEIYSCKVPMDDSGKGCGRGFVQFEAMADAERAIQEMHGREIDGRRLFVGHMVCKKQGPLFTNLYVKNLDAYVDDDNLRDMFAAYGTVKSAVVMRDDGGKSQAFGFVDFEKPECAIRAIEGLHGRAVDGKRLYVARAQKKEERKQALRQKYMAEKIERAERYRDRNVYVKGLHEDTDDAGLLAVFSRFGPVVSHRVMRHKDGESRRFGFVCFAAAEDARRAIRGTHGATVRGCRLYVGIAEEKQARLARLERVMSEAEDNESACYDSDWSIPAVSRSSSRHQSRVGSATRGQTPEDVRRAQPCWPPGIRMSCSSLVGGVPPGLSGMRGRGWWEEEGHRAGMPPRVPRRAHVGDRSPRGVEAPPVVGAYKDVPYEELDEQQQERHNRAPHEEQQEGRHYRGLEAQGYHSDGNRTPEVEHMGTGGARAMPRDPLGVDWHRRERQVDWQQLEWQPSGRQQSEWRRHGQGWAGREGADGHGWSRGPVRDVYLGQGHGDVYTGRGHEDVWNREEWGVGKYYEGGFEGERSEKVGRPGGEVRAWDWDRTPEGGDGRQCDRDPDWGRAREEEGWGYERRRLAMDEEMPAGGSYYEERRGDWGGRDGVAWARER